MPFAQKITLNCEKMSSAFGYHDSAESLAANFLGSEAGDGAYAMQEHMIYPQSSTHSNSSGSASTPPEKGGRRAGGFPHAANDIQRPGTSALSSNPEYFSDQALQTESCFLRDSLIGNDEAMSDSLKTFYTHTLDDGMREMDDASRVTRMAANDAHYVQRKVESVRRANGSNFFNHGIIFSNKKRISSRASINARIHTT